jgi:hypothetical protein
MSLVHPNNGSISALLTSLERHEQPSGRSDQRLAGAGAPLPAFLWVSPTRAASRPFFRMKINGGEGKVRVSCDCCNGCLSQREDEPMTDVRRASILCGEIDDRRQNQDRRRAPRRKMWKSGRIFWPNGDSSDCIVRNLSESGAQLERLGPVPNRFDLVVDGQGWRAPCSVVWRDENRVGVIFDEQLRFTLKPLARARQLADFRRYCDECLRLAKRVATTDREVLLEMSQAWSAVIRRLRKQVG